MATRLDRWNRVIRDSEIVQGSWRLTRDHVLEYRRQEGEEEILLSGPLVRTEPLGLTFRVSQSSVDEDVIGRELTLRGRWQADDQNRLEFAVESRQGQGDSLTLEGAWQLGTGQEIVYRMAPSGRLLRFQGIWDVDENSQLVYTLERSSDSEFRFRGAFQTPSVLPKTGQIRYQLGAEVEGRRRSGPAITLFGKWKLSRTLGLTLEMPCRDGRVRGIDFGADFSPDENGRIVVELQTRKGKPLGVEVTLSRRFAQKQGELFARLRRSLEETAVEGGVRWRW